MKQFRPDLAFVSIPTASRPFKQLILRIEELAPYGSVGAPPIGNPRHITDVHEKHHRLTRKLEASTRSVRLFSMRQGLEMTGLPVISIPFKSYRFR